MSKTHAGTIVAIWCGLWAGCRGPQQMSEINSPTQNHDNTPAVASVATEVREEHFPDGTVSQRVEGYVDEDGRFIPHGVMTYFWESGKKKSEVHYVHGVRNGPRTAWHENGQVWSTGQFVDNREDGVWTEWYPNGNKAREFHFKNGAWHGMYTEWYPNGQKKLEVEYVNGKRQGMLTGWDEYGTVVKTIEYVDNIPQP